MSNKKINTTFPVLHILSQSQAYIPGGHIQFFHMYVLSLVFYMQTTLILVTILISWNLHIKFYEIYCTNDLV